MPAELKTLTKLGLVILLLFGTGLLLFSLLSRSPASSNLSSAAVDPAKLVPTWSYRQATSSATVTLVEFGDFQCPSCAAIYPAVEQLLQEESGQINFVFRNFPLPQHPNAVSAAEASLAAGSQGKYWEMVGDLYQHQGEWSTPANPLPVYQKYAQALGLNLSQFNQDLSSHRFLSLINADISDGNALGLSATPTFYINNRLFTGALGYSDLKAAINAAAHPAP
ncbi:DsbA family protein [Patescibacteria group bacterium]|nr:DsbA family protein [Patescibacteria group bacterium]